MNSLQKIVLLAVAFIVIIMIFFPPCIVSLSLETKQSLAGKVDPECYSPNAKEEYRFIFNLHERKTKHQINFNNYYILTRYNIDTQKLAVQLVGVLLLGTFVFFICKGKNKNGVQEEAEEPQNLAGGSEKHHATNEHATTNPVSHNQN